MLRYLIYHLVLPAKYRRAVFDEAVDGVIKDVCLDIEKRYQLKFMEIGTDKDHVHFWSSQFRRIVSLKL